MDKLQEVSECGDLVDWLLLNSFSVLNVETKLHVVNRLGRSCPNLITLKSTDGIQNRGFSNNWYGKCQWLTGSIKRQKLFCWSCLLFSNQTEYTTWSKLGFADLKNLRRALDRHSKSKEHLASQCKIKLFGKQNIATSIYSARKTAIISYNNQVRENRNNLKKLIDITIYLAGQDLAFRGHNESSESYNRGNYKELVSLFEKYDDNFNKFINNNVFSGTSKTIQNDLIDSNQKSEVRVFFSWQIDETTDISCLSQLSIIFRYVKNGEVVERFLGFYDVSSGRTAEDLFNFLMSHCEKFDFKTKLVAQTYDGAAVMASELNGLQSKIKSVAPQALFTHCYAHALNLVLSKACNINKHSRIFFSNLTGAKLPSNAATRWNFTSRAVFTVLANKQSLIEVFNFIINNDSFKNDNHTIREATFNLIFAQTDVVGLETEEPTQKRRKITLDAAVDIEQSYRVIFNEILDTVIMQINVRFGDLEKLHKFSVYAKDFLTDLFTSLTKQYPTFDEIQLKNELLVIYNDLQMFDGCTTQNQILEFMHKNELHECLPELYKLLTIIPVTSVSVERSFSALKRIKTYTRNTMDRNRLSNIALISIEKPLLNLLSKNEPQFYDKIIDHFANSTNRRIPLIQCGPKSVQQMRFFLLAAQSKIQYCQKLVHVR
nr:unnamed protein product [Callosobruchus analis]